MDTEEIDLANVDYDDVLHLYRGWRRSEGALKEKTKELNSLRERMKHLQDSHVKFRSQIQALESVKELTISLQTQLSILQQENNQLNMENRRLSEQKQRADEMVASKSASEAETNRILKDIQVEFANLRTRYSEMSYTQRNLEATNAEEQSIRMAAEARLNASEDTIENLRRENKDLKAKLETCNSRMSQYDLELTHASEHLRNFSLEVSTIAECNRRTTTAEAEVGLLKGDISRLLRLLEHYPAAKKFIRHWQDSQGMTFLGLGSEGADELDEILNMSGNRPMHDDMNDEDDDMEASWADAGITPSELAHMKRVHSGGDLYPMTSTIEEEIDLWVPRDATAQGVKYWASRMPHTPKSVITDFLRSMNKVWLRRERRKVRRVKEVYDQSIGDLKRQLSHARPYKGVIAERQIRRLKSQVLEKTKKQLTGKPKSRLSMTAEELMTERDSDGEAEAEAFLAPHQRRLCQQIHRQEEMLASSLHNSSVTASLNEISAKKLLEVSLNSLETMGRHQMSGSYTGSGHGSPSGSRSGSPAHFRMHGSTGLAGGVDEGLHPTENYLKGALWLGKNLTMITEEMWEDIDDFRSRFLSQVAAAAADADLGRSCHRLNMLAASGVTQALAVATKGKLQARDILKGVTGLSSGDYKAYRAFARTLPVEATLESHSQAAHSPGMGSAHSHGHSHGHTPVVASPQPSPRHFSNISHISNYSR